MDDGDQPKPPYVEARIQSIARAKALLDAMGSGDWVTLRELAAQAGLIKTTAFNLINALVETGLAEHSPDTGSYRLSLQHVTYGRAVERRLDIIAVARPYLVTLCAETRETINLALPGPTEVIIADSLEGSHALRVSSYAGTRASYHSTACGRVLLAHKPEDFRRFIYQVAPLQKLTPNTIVDPERLTSVLGDCVANGWTLEMEENELGSACIAAPIYGVGNEVIASVSIAGPAARYGHDTIQRFSKLLISSLGEISESLSQSPRLSGSIEP